MKVSLFLLALVAACVHAYEDWSNWFDIANQDDSDQNLARSVWTNQNQNDWNQNKFRSIYAQNDGGYTQNDDGYTQNNDGYTQSEILNLRNRFLRFEKAFAKFSLRFADLMQRIDRQQSKRISHRIDVVQQEPGIDWWPTFWPMPGGMSP